MTEQDKKILERHKRRLREIVIELKEAGALTDISACFQRGMDDSEFIRQWDADNLKVMSLFATVALYETVRDIIQELTQSN